MRNPGLALSFIPFSDRAQASDWQLMGESGLAQQYADLDSLAQDFGAEGRSIWRVRSYFVARNPVDGSRVRVDYWTRYDCDRQLYQDIATDASEAGSSAWGDAVADPLNRATMVYVCGHLPSGDSAVR